MPTIGPHSRAGVLSKLNGKTKEGRLVRDLRRQLVAHVGGSPNIVQAELIELAVQTKLRIALMDRKHALEVNGLHDRNHYLSWVNTYTRTLAQLGLEPAQPRRKTKTLDDIWQEGAR